MRSFVGQSENKASTIEIRVGKPKAFNGEKKLINFEFSAQLKGINSTKNMFNYCVFVFSGHKNGFPDRFY